MTSLQNPFTHFISPIVISTFIFHVQLLKNVYPTLPVKSQKKKKEKPAMNTSQTFRYCSGCKKRFI